MKPLLFISLMFSTQLFASECPQISGTFLCKSGSRISEKVITQNEDSYQIVSDGIEFTYVTDGKTYDVEATSDMKDGKVTASCQKDKFVVNFKATILYEGSEIAKQSTVSEYSISNQDLVIVQKTKMKGIPLPAVKFNCSKSAGTYAPMRI